MVEPTPGTLLQPGSQIKPISPVGMVSHLMSRVYGMEVVTFTELVSYDDRNYQVKLKKDHSNPHLTELDPNGYLLKVFNSRDSKNKEYFDSLYSMTDFIRKKGVPTPERVPNLDGELMSLQKIYTDLDDPSCSEYIEYMVILQTFIPGTTLDKVPLTTSIFYKSGKFAGVLDSSLLDFYHPYYEKYKTIWSLDSVPQLSEFVYAIEDEGNRKLIENVIEAFIEEVVPDLPNFQKGQIHGDPNNMNILVRERQVSPVSDSSEISTTSTTGSNSSMDVNQDTQEYNICGVIDFNDATYSHPVFDLAMVICYLMLECKLSDPMEVGGHVLAGYLTEFELNSAERSALRLLVCGRLVQSLTMGSYTYMQDPTNDYPLETAARGWPLLYTFWNKPKAEVEKSWNRIVNSYT